MSTNNTRFATEYQLDTVLLISPRGIHPLNKLQIELNLYEDIMGDTISGQLMLSDAVGIINQFGLNGTEFIRISLRKNSGDNYPLVKNYRITSITNRGVNVNNNYEVYTIDFVSEEFIFAEQYRISKAYKNTKISTIIENILTSYIKVGGKNTKAINIENTYGVYDFVLPNKKLFETINWLATYARPEKNPGADMLFFENAGGYFLNSLQTLYEQPIYRKYYLNPKNISNDLNQQASNVMEFKVLNFFDTLDAVTNGTFANKVITFDILTRKVEDNFFSYKDYFKKSKSLNNYGITNNYQNRRYESMHSILNGSDLEMSALRLASSNSEQKLNKFIQGTDGGANNVANDIFIETYLKNRVGQIGLFKNTRIEIAVPGDPSLVVGKTVEFTHFGVGEDRIADPYLSGKYLITALRHSIKTDTYITLLELCKDSVASPYPEFDNSDPLLNNLVKGVQ
jgi:hypothetical protein